MKPPWQTSREAQALFLRLTPEKRALAMEFYTAIDGLSTSEVWGVMSKATHGIDWSKCSKALMASEYVRRAADPGWGYPEGWREVVKAVALALKCKKS